jgi:hypothetical protein
MRNKLPVILLAAVGILMISVPTFSHHSSGGAYSPDVTKTVSGTVKQWLFVNPHVAVAVDVRDEAGNVVTWRAQFGSPNAVGKSFGWNRNSLKPGDKVTIEGHPYFKTPNMVVKKITFPDGKEYVYRPQGYKQVGGRGGDPEFDVD